MFKVASKLVVKHRLTSNLASKLASRRVGNTKVKPSRVAKQSALVVKQLELVIKQPAKQQAIAP
jgi:hypothetical protein